MRIEKMSENDHFTKCSKFDTLKSSSAYTQKSFEHFGKCSILALDYNICNNSIKVKLALSFGYKRILNIIGLD